VTQPPHPGQGWQPGETPQPATTPYSAPGQGDAAPPPPSAPGSGYPQEPGYGYPPGTGPDAPSAPGYPPGAGFAPPVATETDGFSIAAFVLSFTGPLLGFIFGFIGLSRTKGGLRKGRGFAVAGLVISTLSTVAIVIAVVIVFTVGTSFLNTGQIDATDIAVGDCVVDAPEGSVTSVEVVPCTEPHKGEVVGEFTVSGSDYPGEDEVANQAEARCPTYVPDEVDDALSLSYLMPTAGSWEKGDRIVSCLMVSDGDDLTAPISG
jgi:hypothetical protein